MTPEELAAAADPATLGNYLSALPEPPHHHGPLTSVRHDVFQGHHIMIRTTYEVTVDGAPLTAPLVVSDDGQVHSHALPTYEFLSATDTIRALIGNFPDDFPGGVRPADDDHDRNLPHHVHRTGDEGGS
ncbi:hypothetical protein ACFVZC_36445 [Streptomyces marokkonensis]|uniref:Uncharacterized protein n=1 Tax=Streptomyces marokkonensis TaxID=324855 RepID=A0ABW6QID9_9ACTN